MIYYQMLLPPLILRLIEQKEECVVERNETTTHRKRVRVGKVGVRVRGGRGVRVRGVGVRLQV